MQNSNNITKIKEWAEIHTNKKKWFRILEKEKDTFLYIDMGISSFLSLPDAQISMLRIWPANEIRFDADNASYKIIAIDPHKDDFGQEADNKNIHPDCWINKKETIEGKSTETLCPEFSIPDKYNENDIELNISSFAFWVNIEYPNTFSQISCNSLPNASNYWDWQYTTFNPNINQNTIQDHLIEWVNHLIRNKYHSDNDKIDSTCEEIYEWVESKKKKNKTLRCWLLIDVQNTEWTYWGLTNYPGAELLPIQQDVCIIEKKTSRSLQYRLENFMGNTKIKFVTCKPNTDKFKQNFNMQIGEKEVPENLHWVFYSDTLFSNGLTRKFHPSLEIYDPEIIDFMQTKMDDFYNWTQERHLDYYDWVEDLDLDSQTHLQIVTCKPGSRISQITMDIGDWFALNGIRF